MLVQIHLSSALIRPWSLSDAPSLQRYANNQKIAIHLRDIFPFPYTMEHAQAFLAAVSQEWPQTTFALARDAEAIGCIGVRLGKDIHRKTAELGYWLGEPFWGQGIMTEAVQVFTSFAFENFDLHRIFAEPFTSNPASVRVLEQAGFSCEARLNSSIYKNGLVMDSFLFAKTR